MAVGAAAAQLRPSRRNGCEWQQLLHAHPIWLTCFPPPLLAHPQTRRVLAVQVLGSHGLPGTLAVLRHAGALARLWPGTLLVCLLTVSGEPAGFEQLSGLLPLLLLMPALLDLEGRRRRHAPPVSHASEPGSWHVAMQQGSAFICSCRWMLLLALVLAALLACHLSNWRPLSPALSQVFIFAGTSFLLARQLFLAAANLTTNELLLRHK